MNEVSIMTNKGGYHLIDFHGINIVVGGAGVTIAGIHADIENNYYKRTVAANLVIGGTELTEREINFSLSAGTYVGIISETVATGAITYEIVTISDADLVTITTTTITGA